MFVSKDIKVLEIILDIVMFVPSGAALNASNYENDGILWCFIAFMTFICYTELKSWTKENEVKTYSSMCDFIFGV